MTHLRSRLTVHIGIYALLLLLAAAAATTWRGRIHAELAASFDNDLKALTHISELRLALRHLEHPNRDLQKTAHTRATEKLKDLNALQMSDLERSLMRAVTSDFASQLKTGYAEDLRRLKRLNLKQLETRRRAARRASFATYIFMSLAVALSSWGLARSLSRTIIRPIQDLALRVQNLDSDRAWGMKHERSGLWEIDTLYDDVSAAAVRLKVQYAKLEHLNALRGQLVSLASHEYGNFMTAVLTGLSLLELDDLPAERRQKLFGIVRSNAQLLVRLGEDFLNLARADLGIIELEKSPLDFGQLIRGFISVSELRAVSRGIRLQVEIEKDLPEVRGHRATLAFVVNSLISNALKYGKDGGSAQVRLRRIDDAIEFSVRDDGVGMDEDTIKKVLAGGYRGKDFRATTQGFGVGLSMAQEILAAHGTRLEIESQPGRGSTLRVRLPILSGSTASA
ncbi:MAG: HAMP domain-containing sensor histidine kinase [Elusimicrobiota bacterium]